jgi:hypothetical protein
MATSTSISNIIIYAKISQYLAANDISKTLIFKGGPPPNTRLSRLLYIVRKQVSLVFTNNPLDSTLDSTANYLYALCGKYINQAKLILGQGGSGAIVNPTTGTATSLTGVFVQFKIGDPGSLMNAGDTVLTLTYADPIGGTVSVDLDGIELPQNDSLQVSYTVAYSTTGVVITFNQGVLDQQTYQIRFLRFIPIT